MVTEENTQIPRKTEELSKSSVYKVVVFTDRAEIHRSESYASLPLGKNELLFKGLPQSIDRNSVRVEGKGKASLLDVSFPQRLPGNPDEKDQENRLAKWNKELEIAQSKKEEIQFEIDRWNKMKKVLDSYADSLSKGNSGNLLDSKNMENMLKFLERFSQSNTDCDSKLIELSIAQTKIVNEIQILETKIREYNPHDKGQMITDLVVLIEMTEDNSKLDLDISYVVHGASWIPRYDVRVEEKKMRLMYYGEISQSTGEDWKNVYVSLSTAIPAAGGEPPKLETLKASLYSPVYRTRSLKKKGGFGMSFIASSATLPREEEEVTFDIRAAPIQASVTSSSVSATFDIPYKTTIPSDPTSHRVNITEMDLDPTFEYITHPKLSAHAFLKAFVKNTSEFQLMEGVSSVYIDGNFVANSRIPTVSPLEEFECSLGLDSSVKINYKPAKKYQVTSGVISKTITENITHEIEIKNTKKVPVKISVVEQYPSSTHEKIKVTMLEPEIKKGEESEAEFNDNGNVCWSLQIGSNSSKTVKLVYQISRPNGLEYLYQ